MVVKLIVVVKLIISASAMLAFNGYDKSNIIVAHTCIFLTLGSPVQGALLDT